VDAKRVGTIGCYAHVDDGIVEPRPGGVGLAGGRFGRQVDDAFMGVRKAQFALRQEHAVGGLAADLAGLEIDAGPRDVTAGGAKTPFMPARALGAPQTTCTGVPDPVSTMQTRRRSAFGCWRASVTLAMVKERSFSAGLESSSSSSPRWVSASAISPAGASVSRWSLSQERVNFILRFLE
jgi:hypothetical protein